MVNLAILTHHAFVTLAPNPSHQMWSFYTVLLIFKQAQNKVKTPVKIFFLAIFTIKDITNKGRNEFCLQVYPF